MKKIHKRLLASLLAAAMLAAQMTTLAEALPDAVSAGDNVNLALQEGVTATADDTEVDTFSAANTIDGDYSDTSRWGSNNDGQGTTARTLTLDLGKTCTIHSVKVFWEKANILEYHVETSVNNQDWVEQKHIVAETGTREEEHVFAAPVDAQYIRLRVTKYGPAVANWYNVGVREFEVYGQQKVVLGNLARLPGVTAAADNTDGNVFVAANTIDGDYSAESRWGSENDGKGTTARTLTLDLGASRSIHHVKVFWENPNILEYYVETSANNQDWVEQKHVVAEAGTLEEEHAFAAPVDAQYIRLRVTKYAPAVGTWYNVGVREFEVFGSMPEIVEPQVPEDTLLEQPAGTNLARLDAVTATATNVESGTSFNADKARDGNTTAKNSRWATDRDVANPTITYNLGGKYHVGSVILYWESNNPDEWYVETSLDGENWDTQKSFTGKLAKSDAPVQTVNFDQVVEARYVRVRVARYSSSWWNNVALYEFEVYQEASEIVTSPDEIAATLAQSAAVENGKVVLSGLVPEKYDAVIGCNYEQVVSADGTIHTPLVDTRVEIAVTVREKADPTKCGTAKVALTIPGTHTANEGNAKPAVAPELAQWYSAAEQSGKVFTLTEKSRIVADAAMQAVAVELQKDVKNRFGLELPIVESGVQAGDIQLMQVQADGFDTETYNMVVTDHVAIEAIHPTGAYWGTRSVLQALVLSNNLTIAQGTARDYPEFKVRGFMLDVGRKPVSMATLRDIVKNMAWYKMNDFHIHLSDNLIFMEDYANAGKREEAWNSYQGFRLESSKEGLTSKDYFYTKQEFKNFIQDSRALGVNITPEIDVPAHALSVANYIKNTLQRPDLVLHKSGNPNRPWFDHVDISKPEAIEIIKGIFDEYIDEDVFDKNTVIHIGADEFYDSHAAYRNFLIEMIDYIQNVKGYQVRVWGSLSQMSNNASEHPFTANDVQGAQMNIWNTNWARPQDMYNLGFDLINTVDRQLYMVPNGTGNTGAYGDFLNVQSLYNNWVPENIGDVQIPAGSDQMLGAAFAIWQDNIDTRAAGINETDTFARFMNAMPYLGVKMWGVGSDGLDRDFAAAQANVTALGTAPNTNPFHAVDLAPDTDAYAQYTFRNTHDISGNRHDLTLHNAVLTDGSLQLKGGSSYAETGLDVMGPNNSLTFKVYKDSAAKDSEQILFEADAAYGETTVKALPAANNKWKLGFARELYEYEFNYELPHDQWVELTIRNAGNKTYLVVNGQQVAAVGSFLPDEHATTQFMGKTGIQHASFDIPVARIGSTTHAFQGKIDQVVLHANGVTPTARYEVQFVSDDGSELYHAVVAAGQAVVEPEAPAKAGFVFGGWYSNKACTEAYDFAAPVEQDLTLYAKWTAVNKDVLKQQITKAEAMVENADAYLPANWQQLVDALEAAKKVADNQAATDAEVQEAADALSQAIAAQQRKADKTALEKLVKQAEAKDLEGYTEETVDAFQTALAEAKAVLADEALSEKEQNQVDTAAANLKAALEGLEVIEPTTPPTEKPTTPPTEKPTTPPTEVPTEKPTTPPTETPTEKPTTPPTVAPTEKPATPPANGSTATGDATHLFGWSLLFMISLAGAAGTGFVWQKSRKHSN